MCYIIYFLFVKKFYSRWNTDVTMTIAALIINVFPLFKVTNFCQVDFAIGCWIYSILCECGIIASNFVFNIRFMQRISPLNLLDSLLNLIFQVFKFSTQLWKSLLVWKWQHISANIDSHLFSFVLFVFYFCRLVSICRGWLWQTLRARGGWGGRPVAGSEGI